MKCRSSARMIMVLAMIGSNACLPAGRVVAEQRDPGPMAAEVVNTHNSYRREVPVPDLAWSAQLAEHARRWADQLALLGGQRLEHSGSADRIGEGENVWIGTAGHFSFREMVDFWGKEKELFRKGVFPDVSADGTWYSVGHYTQIIWGETHYVGCAKTTAGGNDILVCRYSPPGNRSGRPVY